jgi:hypothetical protein
MVLPFWPLKAERPTAGDVKLSIALAVPAGATQA